MTCTDQAQSANSPTADEAADHSKIVDGYFRIVAHVGPIQAFSFPIHGHARLADGGNQANGPAFDLTSSFTAKPRPMSDMPLALLIEPIALSVLGGEASFSLTVGAAVTERPFRVRRSARKLVFDLGDGVWIDEYHPEANLGAALEDHLLAAGAQIIVLQNLPDDEETREVPAVAAPPAFTSSDLDASPRAPDPHSVPARFVPFTDIEAPTGIEPAPILHPIASADLADAPDLVASENQEWPAPHAIPCATAPEAVIAAP
jgi:hypothetical protein